MTYNLAAFYVLEVLGVLTVSYFVISLTVKVVNIVRRRRESKA